MKQNGNNMVSGSYYIGLDAGTSSVGWAVSDKAYRLLKFHGNAMWGARLFGKAQPAANRRLFRVNRRRLARRNQRLNSLELLFSEELSRVDPGFLVRMKESSLWLDDKTNKACRFSLFHDPNFTDKDYYRKYPTIYHLREELLRSSSPHDIRLVYLALHHIMKSRGHFLYDGIDSDSPLPTPEDAIKELTAFLEETYDISLQLSDPAEFFHTLSLGNMGIQEKQKRLRAAWGGTTAEEDPIDLSVAIDMLSGGKRKLAALYKNESLSESEISRLSLNEDLDEKMDILSSVLGSDAELLFLLKEVYDAVRLSKMLNRHASLSEAKVALYNDNKAALHALKCYVRKTIPEKYKEIFSLKKTGLNNFAAYSRYQANSGDYTCKQEDFCRYLSGCIPVPDPCDEKMCSIFQQIRDNTFLPKLKSSENGVIPYQLQFRELKQILKNASEYLPFLNIKDDDGYTVREKIEEIFKFRIPYYVGPLNGHAGSHWAVRFPDKEHVPVHPWNFDQVINTEDSAEAFMINLIGRCTYTGEPVLPKDSLLYSEYMLLNELNSLRIHGQPLPAAVKAEMIHDLFEASRKRVGKKQIENYLKSRGLISPSDEISGIDDTMKTTLKSFHDFRGILKKTGNNREMVEDIIRHILIFGKDRSMMKKWLRSHTTGLSEEDFNYICRLKYGEWGRLSKCFLTEIVSKPDKSTGEVHTIIELLRSGSDNLMQLLYEDPMLLQHAEEHRRDLFGADQSLSDRMDSMYLSPAVRRSIRQSLQIVDEIVDIQKSVPEKIFIEMARGGSKEMKGKRTESRKEKLLALYKNCREDEKELLAQLEQEDDTTLRSNKLYLYYTQFGKCMYSGEPIDLEALMSGRLFDRDHIFPQSRIKDDSLDNLVIVKNTLNRDKTNVYPIRAEIRHKMRPFWEHLLKAGMISQKKFDRLVRSTELTTDELSSFVARQLTETQQSTKALATLLKERYGDAVRIVYSKAGNVSSFRDKNALLKCRDVNDLHHAKDAYLNIVVGNVYCTRFTDQFFKNISQENYNVNKVFDFDVKGAWDATESMKTVRKVMEKNNPIITRMPREVKGSLFDLQLMPKGKGQLNRKQTMDKDKYGGYNKVTGSFYFAAEHTEKKKRIRTIEPVYLYASELYKRDPVAYCKEVLGLTDPIIICREIRANAPLEINGSRLYISGRTGNYYVCQHSVQLAIDPEREKYVRDIGKYMERCNGLRKELPITQKDGITRERNEDLYRFFLEKLRTNAYHRLNSMSNMEKDLADAFPVFLEKTEYEQVRILLEILKSFRCDSVYANLKDLGKTGTAGRVQINKKISGCQSAYLIHQSVTGLYEYREDLLRDIREELQK